TRLSRHRPTTTRVLRASNLEATRGPAGGDYPDFASRVLRKPPCRMNYEVLYHKFIEDRRQHPVSSDIYSERHHIIPRCEGGTDDRSNLIQLTARDHLFAHLILAKWKGGVHWFIFVM